MFQRYVALGDSFTEGVGDPDLSRPNGWRGWADRFAEALAGLNPEFRYANLAVRGRQLRAIMDDQVPAGLALKPDLVSLQGGTNNLLRPKVDIDAVAEEIEQAVARFRQIGATVVLQTIGDPGNRGAYVAIRGRVAILNEHLRKIAYRQETVVVDNWRFEEGGDPRYWDADRLHLAAPGHHAVAINALDALGVPHTLELLPLPDRAAMSVGDERLARLAWARAHLAPWVHRRLTGRSSGDGISAKRPELLAIEPSQ